MTEHEHNWEWWEVGQHVTAGKTPWTGGWRTCSCGEIQRVEADDAETALSHERYKRISDAIEERRRKQREYNERRKAAAS